MEQGIIWFRNDLRLHHNAAFEAAIACRLSLKAIYIFDQQSDRLGPFRKIFLLEALHELAARLMKLSIPLEIIEGNPNVVIHELITEYNELTLFVNKGYAHEEIRQEQLLKSKEQIILHLFDDGFLIPPSALPFEINALPDTFTEFRKKVERVGLDRLIGEITQHEKLGPSKDHWPINLQMSHPKSAFPFRGGESAALERLHDYLWNTRNLLRYKQTRNGLLGTEYSSKFSPWLACGSICPRRIFSEIKKFEREVEANESTYWLVFELLWREYFRYVMLKYGNKLFLPGGIKGENTRVEPIDAKARFDAWIKGQTGDDFVDANMRELRHTGFMSNRGRQNVASFLVHQLKLDWRRGARYFEKMLIDYDVFSNWGNWAYLAGVGNDPRENRMFNTQKQAEMYDPDKAYRKSWLGG
jgi:deoxyribodipyrimidine photo-lyase